jgi:K+/H+ antiporter YhaU regulatory subunit KhtT
MEVPLSLVQTKFEPDIFKQNTHLKIVALKRDQNVLYSSSQPFEMIIDLYFQRNDSLTILGDIQNIRKFLKNNEKINN